MTAPHMELEEALAHLRGGPSDHDEELDTAERVVRDHISGLFEQYEGVRAELEGIKSSHLHKWIERARRAEEQLETVTAERDRLFRKNLELGQALAFERSAPNPASEPKEEA